MQNPKLRNLDGGALPLDALQQQSYVVAELTALVASCGEQANRLRKNRAALRTEDAKRG
jgi:hypothetical protein